MAREEQPAPDGEIVIAWLGVAVMLRQGLAEALSPYGITPEQHELLALVASGRLTPREVGEASGRDKTTLSRVIARAARAGLVEPSRDAGDRRRQILRLTERGAAIVEQTGRALDRAGSKLLAPLSAKQKRRLEKMLARLRSAAE